MEEIEILFELKQSLESAMVILQEKFEYIGAKKTKDVYFYDPLRKNLMLNNNKLLECCRIREKDGRFYVTYKKDIYKDNVWIYSDEYETPLDDKDAMYHIFNNLGLKKLVTVNNTKYTFLSDMYEIVLEEVDELGIFLEVEVRKNSIDVSIEEQKKLLFNFIKSLKIEVGEELNSGKPELLILKKMS